MGIDALKTWIYPACEVELQAIQVGGLISRAPSVSLRVVMNIVGEEKFCKTPMVEEGGGRRESKSVAQTRERSKIGRAHV